MYIRWIRHIFLEVFRMMLFKVFLFIDIRFEITGALWALIHTIIKFFKTEIVEILYA
eukprot:14669.XXX_261052_261222_1 [CDS] Oithona nana genome sequencing.